MIVAFYTDELLRLRGKGITLYNTDVSTGPSRSNLTDYGHLSILMFDDISCLIINGPRFQILV